MTPVHSNPALHYTTTGWKQGSLDLQIVDQERAGRSTRTSTGAKFRTDSYGHVDSCAPQRRGLSGAHGVGFRPDWMGGGQRSGPNVRIVFRAAHAADHRCLKASPGSAGLCAAQVDEARGDSRAAGRALEMK